MAEKGRPERILEFSLSTLERMNGLALDFGMFLVWFIDTTLQLNVSIKSSQIECYLTNDKL